MVTKKRRHAAVEEWKIRNKTNPNQIIYKNFEWASFNTSQKFIFDLQGLPVKFIVFQQEACYLKGYCELGVQKSVSAIRKMFKDPEMSIMARVCTRGYTIASCIEVHNRVDGPWLVGLPTQGRGENAGLYFEMLATKKQEESKWKEIAWAVSDECKSISFDDIINDIL